MELHQTQKTVASDDHTYRVVCCGRQWGKTTLSVLEMVACAYARKDREIAYFATTYDQARNIAWTMLKDFSRAIWSKQPNESRLELLVRTQDKSESRITLRGFENVETARGQQFDLLVIDEVASMRNWKYAWEAILEPTLAFRQGKCLFISTPLGKNHFFEMYNRGLLENPYWKSWRFKSYENPFLPTERIEQAKATSTKDYFEQEYEASFTSFTGQVYKDFDQAVHVIEPFDIPDNWNVYRGVDFGSTNPTACIWIAVDGDDNWFVCDEHYETGQTIDYHAGRINAKPLSRRVAQTWGDPSGAQWINEFGHRGVYITQANKETGTSNNTWVRLGIEKVAERLKTTPGHIVASVKSQSPNGMPKLFIFSGCVQIIRELETYRWKEKSVTQAQDLNEPDVPEKANDHALDALRYFAVSYAKGSKTDRQLYGEDYASINDGLVKKWSL